MEIAIDGSDEAPIFVQLVNQVKSGVVAGDLTPGFPMPSIRQLANDLGINQNTVAKAYRLLERDLIIVAKGYKGTFIHPDAKANCEIDLAEKASSMMAEAVATLRDAGLTDSEIRIAFSTVMKERS